MVQHQGVVSGVFLLGTIVDDRRMQIRLARNNGGSMMRWKNVTKSLCLFGIGLLLLTPAAPRAIGACPQEGCPNDYACYGPVYFDDVCPNAEPCNCAEGCVFSEENRNSHARPNTCDQDFIISKRGHWTIDVNGQCPTLAWVTIKPFPKPIRLHRFRRVVGSWALTRTAAFLCCPDPAQSNPED